MVIGRDLLTRIDIVTSSHVIGYELFPDLLLSKIEIQGKISLKYGEKYRAFLSLKYREMPCNCHQIQGKKFMFKLYTSYIYLYITIYTHIYQFISIYTDMAILNFCLS